MEKDANYALVGLATLGLAIAMAVFGFWLSNVSFQKDYTNYDIIFQGPINGVDKGGEVRFNGIKVGEVTKIELYHPNTEKVIAHVRMTSDVPVRTDSMSTIEPLGITGVNFIQVTAGTRGQPLLSAITPSGKIPVIASVQSKLSGFLEGGESVVTETVMALQRVNTLLSDENIRGFSRSIKNTQAFTEELQSRKQVIADAQSALQNIDLAAQQITALSRSGQAFVDNDAKASLKSVSTAAAEVEDSAKDLKALLAKVDGTTTEFSTTSLPQITAAAASLQASTDSLARLSRELESSPRGLINKTPAAEKEIRP